MTLQARLDDEARFENEAANTLRIDVENAQHVKANQSQHALTLESRLILLDQNMRLADKADIEDLNTLANMFHQAIIIQRRIAARPISDDPQGGK